MPRAEQDGSLATKITCKACLTVSCRQNGSGKVTLTTYEGETFPAERTIWECPVLNGQIDESQMLLLSGRMGLLLLYEELLEDGGI
jgi:hypothetical protein